jgi:hypothetical protein
MLLIGFWLRNYPMNWISVEERLPDPYHEVMYFAIAEKHNKEIMIGHLTHTGFWTHCCMFYGTNMLNELVVVTHWAELPEFPE